MTDVNEAARKCADLLKKHGLEGWSFKFARVERKIARCWHEAKKIDMNKPFAFLNTWEMIKDVMLHEIAHALVGPGHNHNDTWKAKAAEIGCVHTLGPCVSVDALTIPRERRR